jgi:hypothetical protein
VFNVNGNSYKFLYIHILSAPAWWLLSTPYVLLVHATCHKLFVTTGFATCIGELHMHATCLQQLVRSITTCLATCIGQLHMPLVLLNLCLSLAYATCLCHFYDTAGLCQASCIFQLPTTTCKCPLLISTGITWICLLYLLTSWCNENLATCSLIGQYLTLDMNINHSVTTVDTGMHSSVWDDSLSLT